MLAIIIERYKSNFGYEREFISITKNVIKQRHLCFCAGSFIALQVHQYSKIDFSRMVLITH